MTHDETLARACIEATLRGRKRPPPFPMTGGWIQKLTGVGEHSALRLRALMIRKRLIIPAGSYRQRYRKDQPSGFRVELWQLRDGLGATRRGYATASVRGQVRVNRFGRAELPWYRHPLFGGVPLRLVPHRLRRWHEPPEGARWLGGPLYQHDRPAAA